MPKLYNFGDSQKEQKNHRFLVQYKYKTKIKISNKKNKVFTLHNFLFQKKRIFFKHFVIHIFACVRKRFLLIWAIRQMSANFKLFCFTCKTCECELKLENLNDFQLHSSIGARPTISAQSSTNAVYGIIILCGHKIQILGENSTHLKRF